MGGGLLEWRSKMLTLYVDGPLAKQALDYMAKYNTLAAVTPELLARGHEMFFLQFHLINPVIIKPVCCTI